jgi:hypothetical protein
LAILAWSVTRKVTAGYAPPVASDTRRADTMARSCIAGTGDRRVEQPGAIEIGRDIEFARRSADGGGLVSRSAQPVSSGSIGQSEKE